MDDALSKAKRAVQAELTSETWAAYIRQTVRAGQKYPSCPWSGCDHSECYEQPCFRHSLMSSGCDHLVKCPGDKEFTWAEVWHAGCRGNHYSGAYFFHFLHKQEQFPDEVPCLCPCHYEESGWRPVGDVTDAGSRKSQIETTSLLRSR